MMKDKLNYFSAIKFLYKYIRKSLKHFVRFYLGWFFLTVLEITMPILFGIMIDEIVYRQDVDVFVGISFVFVTLSLFSCLLFFMIYAQHHYLFNMYTLGIKRDLFSHLLNSDAQYMSSAASGDIAVMIQKYPEECMHFVVRNIIHPINGLIKGIAVGVYLMLINWQIGLFALLVTPVAVYINVRFGKKIRGFGNKQRDYYGGYISWLFEMLTGLKDIRLLGAKRKADKTFQKSHDDMFEVNIKTGVSIITAENIIAFTNLVVQMVIFALAGYWAASGDITVGLLTVIVAFYSLFTNTVQQISQGYLDSQTRVSYIQKIYDFLRSPSENVWSGKNELKVTNGEIHFNDISFAYDGGKRVLDGFDLNIQPGERFALVGKSGSGKTTLAYMLIGFYAPQIGSIEIDGQNLAGCSLKSIRGNVGLIQQDVLIFDGSIKDNILLGRRNATDAELRAACNQAGIWDFVKSLPQRLDTLIGNSGNGVGLSGGQKQRIAIARIYLKNPKIIIFDEATSSLDDETEGMIHEEWNRVLAGRTSIVIAHRQSSVMNCARAAVLVGGRVGKVGSPHELAASSGKFQSLFALRGEDNAW